jgi:hypothetical protein
MAHAAAQPAPRAAQPPPKRERPLCGARCRDGHPCKARAAWNPHFGKLSKRCRFHGGLSTGPRSEAGKRKSLKALARGRANRKRTP